MQSNVSIETNDKDIVVKYGLMNLRDQREAAVGSVKYVLSDISDIKKNYFRLGFHLWELQNMKYYEDFGYATMAEFCEANFDMDKSAVSRCINVFLHVCQRKDGNIYSHPTMFMQEKFQDFSYSQLCEMVSMSEEQEKLVKPDMTVQQIRKLKKEIPLSASLIKHCFDYIMHSDSYTRKDCMNELKKSGEQWCSVINGDLNFSCRPGKMQIAGSDTYYSFARLLDKYELNYGFVPESPKEVAMSQLSPEKPAQTDKKYLCVSDLLFKGAVLKSKIKSVDSCGKIKISVYDKDGKFLETIDADILLSGAIGDSKSLVVRECE